MTPKTGNAILGRLTAAASLLDRVILMICTVLLIAMVALNGVEALGRNFGASSLYLVQVSIALSTIVYFLGYAVLLHRDEDVTVGFFHARLPPRVRRVIDVLVQIGAVGFFGVLLHASISYYRLTSFMRSPVLPVAQSTTVIPIICGAALCLATALVRTAATISRGNR